MPPAHRAARSCPPKERYRVRQGVYRILYEIKDDQLIITVVKIGHGREVYR